MRTHPLRHNHAGRGSHRTRCLALGLCLTAGLALSACGPAHKGQLTVEPVSASAEASSTKGSSTKPSHSDTIGHALRIMDDAQRDDHQRENRHLAAER